jgi:Flp pilus assembly pilin Flp
MRRMSGEKILQRKEVSGGMRELRRFLFDESGPELVEWAIVTVILVLATVLILGAIGTQLTAMYQRILDLLRGIGTTPAQPS